jgi:hypothetical protein
MGLNENLIVPLAELYTRNGSLSRQRLFQLDGQPIFTDVIPPHPAFMQGKEPQPPNIASQISEIWEEHDPRREYACRVERDFAEGTARFLVDDPASGRVLAPTNAEVEASSFALSRRESVPPTPSSRRSATPALQGRSPFATANRRSSVGSASSSQQASHTGPDGATQRMQLLGAMSSNTSREITHSILTRWPAERGHQVDDYISVAAEKDGQLLDRARQKRARTGRSRSSLGDTPVPSSGPASKAGSQPLSPLSQPLSQPLSEVFFQEFSELSSQVLPSVESQPPRIQSSQLKAASRTHSKPKQKKRKPGF